MTQQFAQVSSRPGNQEPLSLAYEVTGTGPWLILTHPMATSGKAWGALVPLLAKHFRVVTYDLRGHGCSDVPEPAYSLEAFANDQIGLMNALDIDSAHLCGLAIGGEIAQIVAARIPDRVASLAVADTACFAGSERRLVWEDRMARARSHGMSAVVADFLPKWFSPNFAARAPAIVEAFARGIVATPLRGFIGSAAAVAEFDLRPQLRKVVARTTVIVGALDVATPLSAAAEIVRNIASAELKVIPEAGHFSPIEQPQLFAAHLYAFCVRS